MPVDVIARFLRPAALVIVAVALAACNSSSTIAVSMADAGPDQSVGEGALVTLAGSGSTGSGALTYSWTQTAGTPVTLSDPTAVNPTFTAPIVAADEVLTFQLEVTDNNMSVDVDTVSITIVNNGPTANAGPDQTVVEGDAVALDGSGSSHMTGGVIVSYAWLQTAGPAVVLSDVTAVNPTFTAAVVAADTVLTFELTVTDDDGDTDTDTVDITVLNDTAPVADAGPDQTVNEGDAPVTLDGTGSSDAVGMIVGFAWLQTAGPAVVLSDVTAVNPTFTAPMVAADTVLTFQLTVTDDVGQTGVDTVDVTVQNVNQLPIADAGPDQNVGEAVVVTLDGSASSDDGAITSYQWTQTAGPAVVLSNANQVVATFTSPAGPAVLTFELEVTDDEGAMATDTVDINVAGQGQVTVSGKVTFHEVPHGAPGCGLDYGSIVEMPARLVTVEVIDAGDDITVIASTTTDANGDYSVDLDMNINVFTRVRAEMVETGPAPSWNFQIVDNTSGDAQYVLDGADFNTGVANQIRDILAATVFDGNDYTSRNGAPFAILDAIHDAFQTILAGDATIDFVPLDMHWSINNTSVFGDESIGEIGTSFYRGGDPPDGIYLLGDEDDDTEEYDQHVTVHEFGHYFEDTISRSDSVGGSHGAGDQLDMRVAFGEGWGYALAGIATGDPVVLDSFGANQGVSGGFNVEDGTALGAGANPAPGWYSERSVQEILYDLMDSIDDGMDVLSLGFAPIYAVFVDQQRTTDVFTSIFTFITELKADRPGDAANIDALVADQSIDTIADELGSGESNSGTPANADILPIYKAVVIDGAPTNVCSTDAFGGANKLGTNQYFQFTVPAADNYEFTATATTLAGLTDPDMRVFVFDAVSENLLFIEQFNSGVVDSEVGTSNNTLQSGTNYLLEVFDFNNRSGAPIGSACFDISIASTP